MINNISAKNTNNSSLNQQIVNSGVAPNEHDECSICSLKLGNAYIQIQCNHTFHKPCLNEWIDTLRNKKNAYDDTPKINCPICRRDITKKDLSKLLCPKKLTEELLQTFNVYKHANQIEEKNDLLSEYENLIRSGKQLTQAQLKQVMNFIIDNAYINNIHKEKVFESLYYLIEDVPQETINKVFSVFLNGNDSFHNFEFMIVFSQLDVSVPQEILRELALKHIYKHEVFTANIMDLFFKKGVKLEQNILNRAMFKQAKYGRTSYRMLNILFNNGGRLTIEHANKALLNALEEAIDEDCFLSRHLDQIFNDCIPFFQKMGAELSEAQIYDRVLPLITDMSNEDIYMERLALVFDAGLKLPRTLLHDAMLTLTTEESKFTKLTPDVLQQLYNKEACLTKLELDNAIEVALHSESKFALAILKKLLKMGASLKATA